MAPFAGRPVLELLQAVTLLIAAGYAHPVLPGGDAPAVRSTARRMNAAVAEINAQGGDLPRLVAPAIGSALQVDVVESLLAGSILTGKPAEPDFLVQELQGQLSRGGRTIQRDGKPVTDPVEARRMAGELVRTFLDRRMPVLRRLGVLDA
jgi:hypothetical protein